MFAYLLVALGGALGSIARFWASGFVAARFGEIFPFGTIIVNITGCLAIGFFSTLTDPQGRFAVNPYFRQFFMLGVCGGYTTFSSFSLQTLNLAGDGEWLGAGLNVAVSVVSCLFAVWLGHILAALISR